MISFTERYQDHFKKSLDTIAVTDGTGEPVGFEKAVDEICKLLQKIRSEGKKVMMVGNGGSAGICSHMAVDYWKNGGIRATAFNDSSLLTCISNDYSYAEVFSKPVEMFADQGDLLYCISSSGSSENILNAAAMGAAKGCTVVTFSGFDESNPLRKLGSFNFHVKSHSYGMVEILHLYLIHAILDAYLFTEKKVDVFDRNRILK